MGVKQTTQDMYQHLLQEHAEICNLATTLLRVLVEQQQPPDRVSHLFETLCDRVKWHFADEEATGMFEQIVQSVPHLAATSDTLREEHHELLGNLELLRDRACQGNLTRTRWEELEHGFRDFSNRLTQHEYRENDLLHRTYGQSLPENG